LSRSRSSARLRAEQPGDHALPRSGEKMWGPRPPEERLLKRKRQGLKAGPEVEGVERALAVAQGSGA